MVVVAVSPRLLSDAVRRTLDLDGIRTVEAGSAEADADVAVVTTGREAEVSARRVITLSTGDGASQDWGSISDLAGLRAALADLVPRLPS